MSNIDAITSIGRSTSSSSIPENPGTELDREAFLKLLVAQLKYQDPTKPADTSQMLAQTAQLTMVDRLNDIAVGMEAAAATDRLALAGSMVGRDVSFVTEDGDEVTARVDSVRLTNGQIVLSAGGFLVPLGAVLEVLAPPVDPPVAPPVDPPVDPPVAPPVDPPAGAPPVDPPVDPPESES